MSDSLINVPHLLMVSGQQQNVGKTTLAVNIIQRFSRKHRIYGLKVSPHIHNNTGSAQLLMNKNNWQLLEEMTVNSNKDTSRMLAAGAEKSFLLQGGFSELAEGFLNFLKLVPNDTYIVCESGGLRDFVFPGIFLVIRQLSCKVCTIEDEEMFKLADRIITFTVNGFDFSSTLLEVRNGRWLIKNE
jgi:hypothetical protein